MLLLMLQPSSTSPAISPGKCSAASKVSMASSMCRRYATISLRPGVTTSPFRARVLVAQRVVVGIEEHAICGFEGSVIRTDGTSTNVSKNHVVCAKCHFTGLASGIDWIAQSSAESGDAREPVNWRIEKYLLARSPLGTVRSVAVGESGNKSIAPSVSPRRE